MHPRMFLDSFWQSELRPHVFVAMSFSPSYAKRFFEVFEPAIESIEVEGSKLTAFRVDNSKSGDSILTQIIDGIAHAQLVLADVSTIGKDSVTGLPYRNGNVMYEVGLALASRQPSEVLIVRDDHDPFLFDISAVPHATIDFTDTNTARKEIADNLSERLRERDLMKDLRVRNILACLTPDEFLFISEASKHGRDFRFAPDPTRGKLEFGMFARLADNRIFETIGEVDGRNGHPVWGFTRLGWEVAKLVAMGLEKVLFSANAKDFRAK